MSVASRDASQRSLRSARSAKSHGPTMAPDYAGMEYLPHRYAQQSDARQWSLEDFNARKKVCSLGLDAKCKMRSPQGSGNDSRAASSAGKASSANGSQSARGTPAIIRPPAPGRQAHPHIGSTSGGHSARRDSGREALLSRITQTKERTDFTTMKDLIQPGDLDDGDTEWGVVREQRHGAVPHWSHSQLQLKKRHHAAPIHQTPEHAANHDRQTTVQRAYCHPKTPRLPNETTPDDGPSHMHNSHAHLSLARRRHNVDMKHNGHSTGQGGHRRASSEYSGASRSSRHSLDPQRRAPHHKRGLHPQSSQYDLQMRECFVHDGTRKMPMAELYTAEDIIDDPNERQWLKTQTNGFARSPRSEYSRVDSRGTGASDYDWHDYEVPDRWSHQLQNRHPEPHNSHNFHTAPGKPPPPEHRLPMAKCESRHAYRSQKELQYDKHLCQAEAYRHSGGTCGAHLLDPSNAHAAFSTVGHSDKWEHIGAGSHGSSIRASDVDSRSAGGGSRRSRSADPSRRRAASSDASRHTFDKLANHDIRHYQL